MASRITGLSETQIIEDILREQRRQRVTFVSQKPQPAKDALVISTNGQPATWTLSAIPLDGSEGSSVNLSLNGVELVEGVDYTVDYATGIVSFSSAQQALFCATPAPADRLTADYLTTGDLIALAGPADFGSISDGFIGPVNQHLGGRATSDGHGTWVVPLGDFLTVNPGVQSVGTPTNIGYIETNSSDGTVQCDITPDILGQYYAVLARYVDTSNYWYFEMTNSASSGRVVHNSAGTPTVVASGLAVGGAGPFTMKVVMSGTTLQFYNGSTLLYTDTGGALSTATKHGIWSGGHGSGQLFANWSWSG